MNKVTIIGTGNVATHLCVALAGEVEELINISSRELGDIPVDSDIYIIAVSDDAIATVAEAMPSVEGIVAHTAGSVPMQVLSPYFKKTGVFYPLQTFTKESVLEYSKTPVFVEGTDSAVEGQLLGLASLFTPHLHKADSAKREKLHLASVFACNFVNALWGIADGILAEADLPFKVLLPLIEATAEKIKSMPPKEAQTGPAARHDHKVMERHKSELSLNTDYRHLYTLMSEIIMAMNPKK